MHGGRHAPSPAGGASATGSNHPTVRRAGARYVLRHPRHIVERHRGQPRFEAVIQVHVADAVEIPDLVRDVGHAVGLEDQAGAKLMTRTREFLRRDPAGTHGGKRLVGGCLDRGGLNAVGRPYRRSL